MPSKFGGGLARKKKKGVFPKYLGFLISLLYEKKFSYGNFQRAKNENMKEMVKKLFLFKNETSLKRK